MGTTVYPLDAASDFTGLTAYAEKSLGLDTRGGAAASTADSTIAGTASGTLIGPWGANPNWLAFISPQLEAVTISGQIAINVRAAESNAMANYGVGVRIGKVASGDTAPQSLQSSGLVGAELGTTEAARTGNWTPGASLSILAGERLVVILAWYGAGGTTASGYTATGYYNGPTAAASGDSYITLTETLVEYTPPASDPSGSTGQSRRRRLLLMGAG